MLRRLAVAAVILALAGCVVTAGGGTNASGGGKDTQGDKLDTSAATDRISGIVLGQDGKPAPRIEVTAYISGNNPLIGNAGAGLVGNAGAGLVGNSGGGLVNNAGGALAGNTGVALAGQESSFRVGVTRRVLTVGKTQTDDEGRFVLSPTATGALNLEAVKDKSSKAWKAEVEYLRTGSALSVGNLQLAPTGTLTGRVTAPDAPTVTDFTGVDVFIPGSSYTAKTDDQGRYTIDSVPAGTFRLVATKPGLGEARLEGVAVPSGGTRTAPDLALGVKAPRIAAIEPGNGGEESDVTIRGENFGASTGRTLEVSFNGPAAVTVTRVDDATIRAQVPPGAKSGNLIVKVDGIVSNGIPFQILRKPLAFVPTALDLRLGATASLTLDARDTDGAVVPDPAAAWTLEGAAAGLTGSGKSRTVAGLEIGDGTISARSGSAVGSVAVHVFRVDGVTLGLAAPVTVDGQALTAGSLVLYAPPHDGSEPDPDIVTSVRLVATVQASDARGRLVVWESSNPARVAVADGVVRAMPSRTGATEILTARAADDPSVFATASVLVRASGFLDVGVQ